MMGIALRCAFGLLAAAMVNAPVPEPEEPPVYIGECTITAYCPCRKCCGKWADGLTATGIPAEPGVVATDPDVIPLGSTVIIDGVEYLAADTGSGVKGLHVDVCAGTHAEAENAGISIKKVWVIGG